MKMEKRWVRECMEVGGGGGRKEDMEEEEL